MRFVQSLLAWLTGKRARPDAAPTPEAVARPLPAKPPIIFAGTSEIAKIIPDAEVENDRVYVVSHNGKRFWAILRCPCGCGAVISLPLTSTHDPYWRVTVEQSGRPSLFPSVWRNGGCMSHFWLEDGRVFWTANTGIAPSVARPDLYSPRPR